MSCSGFNDCVIALHGYVIGFTIIGSWLVIMLISLGLRAFKGDGDAPWFWRIVSIAQVLLGVQLLLGIYLFVRGGLPGAGRGTTTFEHVFHPLYGFVFPMVVLFYAHKFAREGRANPYTAFATAGLVIFGLTARGWQAVVLPG